MSFLLTFVHMYVEELATVERWLVFVTRSSSKLHPIIYFRLMFHARNNFAWDHIKTHIFTFGRVHSMHFKPGLLIIALFPYC